MPRRLANVTWVKHNGLKISHHKFKIWLMVPIDMLLGPSATIDIPAIKFSVQCLVHKLVGEGPKLN